MWFLEWWPYAIGHGINPFVSRAVWAPQGVNLAWSINIPFPSLVLSPVTALFGPVVSYNVIALLSPALAALTAFVLCRHVTRSFTASLLGGYLYGFGTYELSQMLGRLQHMVIFLAPLVVYLVLRLLEGSISRRWFVPLLGLCLAAQFLSSTEIFLTFTLVGGATLLLALVFIPSVRPRFAAAVIPIVAAFGLCALLVSPYIYYGLSPGLPNRDFVDAQNFSADLANFFFPTRLTWLGHTAFRGVAQHLQGGNIGERSAYLGLPLIALVASFVTRFWRQAVGKILTLVLVGVIVAALGPRLHIDGSEALGLPWKLAVHLPLLRNAVPSRFTMYAFLIVGIMAALWLADARGTPWKKWALAGLSVLFLLPNLGTNLYHRSDIRIPAFFDQGVYKRYLHEGDTIMILPLAPQDEMLWQARSSMYFRLASGYVGSPYADKTRLLDESRGIPHAPAGFNRFAREHGVSAVVYVPGADVAPSNQLPPDVWTRLRASLGVKPVRTGGVLLYRLRSSPT
jgi:hypothetical protein